MRRINPEMAPLVSEFMPYSQKLAIQLDTLWKCSFKIITRDQIDAGDQTTLPISALRRSVIIFLKAMPHLFNGLQEPLRSDFLKNGLDALSNKADKDKFEWVLNNQVYNRLSPQDAASADVGFSNILAMHTGDAGHKPLPYEIHLRFKPFSPIMARQVAVLHERATYGDGNTYTLTKTRLHKSLLSLAEILPLIFTHLPKDLTQRIIDQGLNCLLDDNNYNIIEHFGVHESSNVKKLPTKFDEALTNLRSMHFYQSYKPFSHLNLERQSIDISRAMVLNYSSFCDLKFLMETVGFYYENDGNKNDSSISDSLNSSANHIIRLLENELNGHSEDLPIQERIAAHSEIVMAYINNLTSQPHSFKAFLKRISPNEFGEYRLVELRNEKQFVEFLRSISDDFVLDYQKYLDRHVASHSTVSNQKVFAKYLHAHQEHELIRSVIQILKSRGVKGLAENDGLGFFKLSEHFDILTEQKENAVRSPLTSALDMYNIINDSNLKLHHFLPFTIVFENDNDGTVSSLDFSFIAQRYKKVFDDFFDYAQVSKARTDGEAIQQVTIKNHLAVALSTLKRYNDTLNTNDLDLLNQYGLNALAKSNNRLLKHFRQLILSDNNSRVINSSHAVSMQHALNQLASFFGAEKADTYRVSISKTEKLAERNSQRNLYSFEQVVHIAYAIEKCLRRDDLTNLQNLSLHAARVLVKTGWNLTPTLELDNDDLIYFDTSFQGNKTAAVRLFKRRAGYKTLWANFSKGESLKAIDGETALGEFETGKVTAAVISNLEFIREMTNGIAYKHILPNLRNRIFAYTSGSKVKILTGQSFTKCINALLKSEGIDAPFSVTKIRKKGMNYTYRKVAKNFEKYQKAGMHTPEAFYQYYLKMDGAEVEASLTKATSVMGDFLLRGITDNVIFVSKPPVNSKQTPNGRCVQTQDSDVVTQFKKQNRNFFSEEEVTVCADFGACLFCDHFRCVADSEHVWRLLSFEKVVIERMVSASYSIGGDDGSDQQRSIQNVKLRVQNILHDLSKINSSAIKQGEDIFKQHGVHPDWEMA